MLSLETSKFLDLYRLYRGMVNTAWVTGLIQEISPDRTRGYIMQTMNKNHWLPFRTRPGDVIPSWIKNGQPIQLVARIHGNYDAESGNRTAELHALRFDVADVIAMPPTEIFDLTVPEGAPSAETRPVFGKGGLRTSRNWNIVHLAGYIGAMKLEKPRMVPDTRPGAEPGAQRLSKGTLTILLQQEGNPEKAIPVRLRGGKVETIHNALKRGVPIYLMEAQFMVMTKAIEGVEPDASGIVPRLLLPYVHADKIGVATSEQIAAKPDWVAGLELPMKIATPPRAMETVVSAEPEERPVPANTAKETDASAMIARLGLTEESLSEL